MDEDDVPLFATRMPSGGMTAGLSAIAALIDEDEAPQGHGRKRKHASMGEAQVQLALAGCDDIFSSAPSCAACQSSAARPVAALARPAISHSGIDRMDSGPTEEDASPAPQRRRISNHDGDVGSVAGNQLTAPTMMRVVLPRQEGVVLDSSVARFAESDHTRAEEGAPRRSEDVRGSLSSEPWIE